MFSIHYDTPSPVSAKFRTPYDIHERQAVDAAFRALGNERYNPKELFFSAEEKMMIEATCRQLAEVSRKTMLSLPIWGEPNSATKALIAEWFGSTPYKDVLAGAQKMDRFIQGAGRVTFVDQRRKTQRAINVDDPMNKSLDNYLPVTKCDYAYVFLLPDRHATGVGHVGSGIRLYLGGRFFSTSKTLTDRTATLYHEIAHKILMAADIGYKPDVCRQLAKTAPANAIKNADSWCFFATSTIIKWP
jgi:hypothetical protein